MSGGLGRALDGCRVCEGREAGDESSSVRGGGGGGGLLIAWADEEPQGPKFRYYSEI